MLYGLMLSIKQQIEQRISKVEMKITRWMCGMIKENRISNGYIIREI